MAANLNDFKTSKNDCILSKSNFSFAEVHWVIYRIRQENKKFDDMGTLRVRVALSCNELLYGLNYCWCVNYKG